MDSFNLIKLSCVKFGNQPELTNFRADYQGFTLKEDFLQSLEDSLEDEE